MYNKSELSKSIKEAKMLRKLPKPKDIDYVSKMGYRDDSPFNDRPYIDINTPTGLIDMTNTSKPLYANGVYLPPNSGLHQFDTTTVREVPAEYAELTDDEIAAYRAGGYVVEEVDDYKDGGTDVRFSPKHNPANSFSVTDPRSLGTGGSYVDAQITHFQDGGEDDGQSSILLKNIDYDRTHTVNPSAYIYPTFEENNSNFYKYGYVAPTANKTLEGGFGFGLPKQGLEANLSGAVPLNKEDLDYWRGFYNANLSKQLGNVNLGLGVNTQITGQPTSEGFAKDKMKFNPSVSFRYNIPTRQDGGNTDPGNNALELHMFYDKDIYKKQTGGSIDEEICPEGEEFNGTDCIPIQQPVNINEEILKLADSISGGGYNKAYKGSGVPKALVVNDVEILPAATEGTYCSGYTCWAATEAMKNQGLLANMSAEDLKKFQKTWYGSEGFEKGKSESLSTKALEDFGLGKGITKEEALPGDIVQIWRNNNTGHSVILKDWVKDAKGNITGIKYRSSQGSTEGIGDKVEMFKDNIDPNRVYVARIGKFKRGGSYEEDELTDKEIALLRSRGYRVDIVQ